MNQKIVSILRSVPKNHPLSVILDSMLLPELQFPAEIWVSNRTSEFEHFSGIYRRRHAHLNKRNIANYGILESIPCMATYPGKKRGVSIHTQKFNVLIWMDPELKELIGLVIIAKKFKSDEVSDERDQK